MQLTNKSFIVGFWSQIFKYLGLISLLWVINKFVKSARDSHIFIDAWVLGHFGLSIIIFLFYSFLDIPGEVAFVIYGFIRVFELFIYQVNVILFNKYRAERAKKPFGDLDFRRSVILIFLSFIETIFWFALAYNCFNWMLDSSASNVINPLLYLSFSINTMTTFGHTTFSPSGLLGYLVTIIQSAIGLIMILLILAPFISLLTESRKQSS